MGRSLVDVPAGNAGVEGGGDESVTQSVWPDSFRDPGPAGAPADDPTGGVPVKADAVRPAEDWAVHPLADGQGQSHERYAVSREADDLAALAGHGECAVATFQTERFDVAAECLGDPQPVEGEERDQA